MGTKIDMITVTGSGFRFREGNSIRLTSEAAKDCLFLAGVDPCEIGLLINTGIYRHNNAGEPSIASRIQQKINKNPVFGFKRPERTDCCTGTFSFDVNNGGCGWLTGISIADGFIQSGEIKFALIVTGDSDPFPGFSINYNFETSASAIILSKSENCNGFSLFRTYSFPEYLDEFISATHFGILDGKLRSRNVLTINQQKTYLDRCIGCANDSFNMFLEEAGLTEKEIDLVIPSQSPEGFIRGIIKRIDVPFIEIRPPGKKEFHTSGPGFALKLAWDNKSFFKSKNVIFLTVGSGISVSCALYRNLD